MYFIAASGLLMMCLSAVMVVNPNYWADGIVNFSKNLISIGLRSLVG